ncbi:hypothetical protein F5884DRAFT_670807 [Xylogone sp. PMI_703]|nr:hypothetical protein F5884DRAFT_670807 [Xylogone sp. PMI_703]
MATTTLHSPELEHGVPIILEPTIDDLSDLDDVLDDAHDDASKEIQVPTHPIWSMQAAFAESMLEASATSTPTAPQPKILSAETRRKVLLDDSIDAPPPSRWQKKPGQQYHQLWKLMAQISFGIYLLLNGIAKDDEQVMAILQGHVDEVDEFLEMTLEDFDLARRDIDERLQFLKLPLDNIDIFDAMLEDRAFRLQIVSGNEQIEHVINRTATSMNDALRDVQEGLEACKDFRAYLLDIQQDPVWRKERPEMEKVFQAMKGNVEGWYKAYTALQTNGKGLGTALVELGSIVAEMDRRAGEASRKGRVGDAVDLSGWPVLQRHQAAQLTHTRPRTRGPLARYPPSKLARTPVLGARRPLLPPESEFILKPRTYSPAPSPKPPKSAPAEPTIPRRSSLRDRLSFRKKDGPSDTPTLRPPGTSSSPEYWGVPARRSINTASSTPARGVDSAYYSDVDKPPTSLHPNLATRPDLISTSSSPNLHHDFPAPPATASAIPSPVSDRQFFRPVHANPNSPLQRPWTAAPSHTSHVRDTPSAMGMSVMTSMTSMTTTEDGKKVKKKRSAFGWLKKAFSLSEEEKAAFEERRRMGDDGYGGYGYDQGPVFLDGKRIR